MSLDLSDRPIHFPNNPDKFEFDEEVAIIFDNMARRSIPLYEDVHKLHARLTVQEFLHHKSERGGGAPYFGVLDVGASTGNLFKELFNYGATDRQCSVSEMSLHAVDPCPFMVEEIESRYRGVKTHTLSCFDLDQVPEMFNVVALHYVLQFIEPESKEDALRTIRSKMPPGGLLLFSQQEELACPHYQKVVNIHYDNFQVGRGYTHQEISATNHALENSMWLSTAEETHDLLIRCGFSHIQETTRWGNFSSLVCRTYG